MKALADGSSEALVDLFDVAEKPIRLMLLRRLQEVWVWVDNDRLDDLVRDSVLELARLAPSWRADGGAAPWNWAEERLVSLAFGHLGLFTSDLDDQPDVAEEERPASGPDGTYRDVLARLATRHPEVVHLDRALRLIASERDGEIWLEVEAEKAAGNRSPAVTVARVHEMNEAAVRKVCQRIRVRLAALVESDDDFEGLAALPGLAA